MQTVPSNATKNRVLPDNINQDAIPNNSAANNVAVSDGNDPIRLESWRPVKTTTKNEIVLPAIVAANHRQPDSKGTSSRLRTRIIAQRRIEPRPSARSILCGEL